MTFSFLNGLVKNVYIYIYTYSYHRDPVEIKESDICS